MTPESERMHGWIPLAGDGTCWQLWRDDAYLATVSTRFPGHRAWAYIPRHSQKTRPFKNLSSAAAYVKAFDL